MAGMKSTRAFFTAARPWPAAGALVAAALSVGFALPLQAADYPVKPVRWIVPFVPGSTDVQARAVAEKVQARIGQPIVVETKPGARRESPATPPATFSRCWPLQPRPGMPSCA